MPLIDLPLGELLQYRGRNPRPQDFDAYWDRALQELDGTPAAVDMRPAVFQVPDVDAFDLYFTGVRGARVHAQYLRPASAAPHTPVPAVVQFHGYSGNAGDWTEKLRWTAMGFAVAALDVRGQGGLSQDPGGVRGTTLRGHIVRGLADHPDNLLFRHVFLDAARLVQLVMDDPLVNRDRVAVTGWSQGGGLTVAAAALVPGVWRAAPVYPFLSDYQRVWEMDLAQGAYEELREFFRRHDPEHRDEAAIFTRLGYIDIQHLAPRIQSDVLWGVGLMDAICPPSTQFAAYNRITAPKTLRVFPDFGHEGLPGMHDHITQFLLREGVPAPNDE